MPLLFCIANARWPTWCDMMQCTIAMCIVNFPESLQLKGIWHFENWQSYRP